MTIGPISLPIVINKFLSFKAKRQTAIPVLTEVRAELVVLYSCCQWNGNEKIATQCFFLFFFSHCCNLIRLLMFFNWKWFLQRNIILIRTYFQCVTSPSFSVQIIYDLDGLGCNLKAKQKIRWLIQYYFKRTSY